MDYKKFEAIFNKIIFEKSKADLVRKIAKNPERYVGLFRPTQAKAKIIQTLLQSHEIRFGGSFEILIEQYLKEKDFKILNKTVESLKLNQVFANNNKVFFVEQKVRDDHDENSRRGQMYNFEKKISSMLKIYQEKEVVGFFYFIDDSFTKKQKVLYDGTSGVIQEKWTCLTFILW